MEDTDSVFSSQLLTLNKIWQLLASSLFPVQLVNQVLPSYPPQFIDDISPFFGFVPEEELTLRQFLALCLGAEHGFQGIGVETCVPRFGGDGHGGGSKVLYLLQMKVQTLGDDGKFRHVLFLAAGVAGDEVGDKLLPQAFFTIDSVEYLLELSELAERRFAHDVEHAFRGVFRRDFKAAAYMTGYEFAGIFLRAFVGFGVFALVQQQVVAHTAAYE